MAGGFEREGRDRVSSTLTIHVQEHSDYSDFITKEVKQPPQR